MVEARNKSFCSVPGCSCSAQKQPCLSFHSVPVDSDVRSKWSQAIRREEGPNFVIKKGSTYVCSRHFTSEDYILGFSVSRLIPGAVPSLFPWNNFTSHPKRESVYERSNKRLSVLSLTAQNNEIATKVAKLDHNYATPPPPGVRDEAVGHIQDLEAKLKEVALPSLALFSRYCASDDQLRFYTKFPSERVFKIFWESIAPSASRLAYWSKAKRIGQSDITPSPSRRMPFIDEFLMYSMRVVVGMKEQLIADMSEVSVATVSRVTITWANYLFLMLGSLPLWVRIAKVKSVMPATFKMHCPNVSCDTGLHLNCCGDCLFTNIVIRNVLPLQKQDDVEGTDRSRSQWFGNVCLAPVHWKHL